MRGFTLIELLTVIVILAIILIIAVPIINNVIEGVKKSAFQSSVKNIVKSGEFTYANGIFGKNRELVYTFEDSNITGNYPDAKLEFSGEVPISGNLIIREDGKIAASLFNGDYCAVKDYNESEVTIVDKGIDDCYSEISLPTVVLNGMTPVNVEIPLSYADLGAVATTVVGEDITQIDTKIYKNNIEVPSINTSEKGTYKIIYTVYEGSKMNYTEREVNVVDTTKPTLTVPLSTSIVIADVNTFDLLDGVSVTDNSLETLTINVSGNLSRIAGSYNITYSATDSSGNTEEVVQIINVNDIEAPVITLNGASVINLNIGDTYTEVNANATDDAEGNLASSITKTGTVNTSVAGTYLITYTVKDSSNNESSITRTVNVIDNVAPTVTFGTYGNTTYAKTHSTTVTVNDNVAVASRYYQWTTTTTAPSTASFTQSFTNGANIPTPAGVSGSYYLWIKAVDNLGNTSIISSSQFNLDNGIPTLSLINNTIIYVAKNSTYVDFGANANDAYDLSINTRVITSGNVNTSIAGTYTVTYSVTDGAGNVGLPITRTVNVIETSATYTFSSGMQSVVVPLGISKVMIETWGAQGGSPSQPGGRGGYSKAVFSVTPGDILYIYVGGTTTSNVGGYNGGGSAPNNSWGHGGGGATDVRLNGQNLSNRIIVAGGGGGGAMYSGGSGGGLTGTNVYDGVGGLGGTQTSGGSGVSVYQGSSSAGSLGQGGSSGCYVYCGGAGGGGYYGGGGGKGGDDDSAVGGGGGGSGYIKPGATLTEMQTGVRTGNGQARLEFVSEIIDFNYTGSPVNYTTTTNRVMIETWGAQGGKADGFFGQNGGRGGYSKAIFTVTPGDVLSVYVGGTTTTNIGGFNGGGSAPNSSYGKGGGGATDVRLNGQNLSNRIIVAGGGGGGSMYGGGSGGGLNGEMVYDGVGGLGGTQTSGGSGVSVYQGSSSAGSLGQGGSSGCYVYCGGAGGGGYYGGGGGKGGDDDSAVGGGGGGSGYIKPGATLTEMQTGVRTGNGFVRITALN